MIETWRVYDVAMLSHDHIATTEANRMIDVKVIILQMTRFHKFMFEKKNAPELLNVSLKFFLRLRRTARVMCKHAAQKYNNHV